MFTVFQLRPPPPPPPPHMRSQRHEPRCMMTSPSSSSSSSSSSSVGEFWDWACKKGGGICKNVKPGVVAEGLGLLAVTDISRNDIVLEVPQKLWINSDTVAASEIGMQCQGLTPWVAIALFILREKALGSASAWFPYLSILPGSTHSPIFWSEEELSEIRGTQLLSTTEGITDYVHSAFDKVEEEIILPNKHLFPSAITFTNFLWAFGILRSRAFSGLRGENLVLIPVADLVNHSPSITVKDLSWEIRGKGLFSRELIFSLKTPDYVKAEQQVYIQYDLEKSNSELALDYGFIESRSERETYTLTLEIAESDPFYGDKLDIAESNGMSETAYFDIVLGSSLPESMLPYLRLVALGGQDAFLLESIFRNTVWGHLELPVSRANEESICSVIRNACKTALSSYHTTVEEDESLLDKGDLDPKMKIAVGIRLGEKKVLHQIDEIFASRELELDELEYYQERRLKDLGLCGEQGEIIFWEK